MNRRSFLAAALAGAIVTAEELWIPGRKLISIPRPVRMGVDLANGPDRAKMLFVMTPGGRLPESLEEFYATIHPQYWVRAMREGGAVRLFSEPEPGVEYIRPQALRVDSRAAQNGASIIPELFPANDSNRLQRA